MPPNLDRNIIGPPAPAVFLDRDGTLIEDRGHLRSPEEVVFFPETVPALRDLQQRFKLFIVTNQSGIAKGELASEQVAAVNNHVVDVLGRSGIDIAAVYCCPHQRSDNCDCIKPKRFFLDEAARDHNIDLLRSFTVGDHLHDVEFGRSVGATGIYVLTGHGAKHRDHLRGDEIVTRDIGEAADWILKSALA